MLGEKDTLAGLALRALGWSFFSNAFSRLGLMGFGILLARLLGPHQFGTAAVALVALLAVLSFNELGVSLAIVRWPGDPADIAPTVSTISVVSSSLIYVGSFLGAPAFAAAMGAPAATSVIRVLALSTITNGVVSVPAALLGRYFRQGRKMIADQVHGWLGAVLSVSLAWSGFGAMSIAVGQVVGAVAGGTLIIIFSPLPFRFGFNLAKARKLLSFGLPLAGSSLIVFFVANVDNFVAGHTLGATALGFYVLAWNLASWPVNMFSQPVRSVAPALFSRIQNNPIAMRAGFATAVGLLGSVTLPACLAISGAAVPLVGFLYGARWAPAAPALFWLALLAALRILFELSYDYFVVLAKTRVVFTVQLAWLLALIPALIAGGHLDGIRGIAVAGLAIASAVVLPWYLYELGKAGIKLRMLAVRLWLPLGTAVVVGLAALAVSKFINNYFAALIIEGAVTLAAIGILCYKMRRVISNLNPVMDTQDESLPAETPVEAILSEPFSAPSTPALHGEAPGAATAKTTTMMPPAADTVPIPIIRRLRTAPHPTDYMEALPIYQQTVASLSWDPDTTGPHHDAGQRRVVPAVARSGTAAASQRRDQMRINQQQVLPQQKETLT